MAFDLDHYNDDVLSEINMTPLVDVMLVLLVIFIITMPVLQHAVKVELPKASSVRLQSEVKSLNLNVNAQGELSLNQQPMSLEALGEALQLEAQSDPQPQLKFLADQNVAYKHVAQAMGVAKRAGITNLAFVTTP